MKQISDNILSLRDFTEDAEKYVLLKSFWTETIQELTGQGVNSYVYNVYANGKEIMDGNPIFSTKLDNKRGIRIIQTEIDPEEPVFITWKSQIEIQEIKIDELVISLQLSPETFFEMRSLVKLFLVDALTNEVIKSINEKYETITTVSKLNHTINSVEFIDHVKIFRNWPSHHFTFQNSHMNILKQFYVDYSEEQDTLHMIHLGGKTNLHKIYSRFVKNMDYIFTLVDLDDFDFDKEHIQKFTEIVTHKCGSTDKYLVELKKYSSLADKQYVELKDKLHLYDLEH